MADTQTSADKVAKIIMEKIAEAVNTAIKNAPYCLYKRARIAEVSSNYVSAYIDEKLYTKISMLTSVEELEVNDIVVCLVPNGNMSDMFVIGKLRDTKLIADDDSYYIVQN